MLHQSSYWLFCSNERRSIRRWPDIPEVLFFEVLHLSRIENVCYLCLNLVTLCDWLHNHKVT